MQYIYLHGFASSPRSTKAQYLRDRFAEVGIPLNVLDLNQGDFSHLTLTRQLQQTAAIFPERYIPVTLIGSSFGGLTAAWLAQQLPQVHRVICLAPAFDFLSHWLPKLTEAEIRQWQESGYLSVYHYGEERYLPLSYEFVLDTTQYDETQLQRRVPTLIFHGLQDETIPIETSQNYASQRPWVQLIELDSDHSLGNVLPQIWQAICQFCFKTGSRGANSDRDFKIQNEAEGQTAKDEGPKRND
ncbi:MAG: YqiA/YcfP family alpha/beta fold hydrolase [Cyanobacteriota bacterium]|nr:YqiA/YcfP family alpha/beta fold hydrolase [Cyanobacteriota bacterium]